MLKPMLLAALLLSASAATAQSHPTAAAQTQPSAAPAAGGISFGMDGPGKSDLERVVCKHQEQIGTRLGGHKVCMTVAQWQQYEDDVRDQTQHLQANIGIVSH